MHYIPLVRKLLALACLLLLLRALLLADSDHVTALYCLSVDASEAAYCFGAATGYIFAKVLPYFVLYLLVTAPLSWLEKRRVR